MEEELRARLDAIHATLKKLHFEQASTWRAFRRGLLRGAGTVIGVVGIVAVIGWVLDIAGLIPELDLIVEDLQGVLDAYNAGTVDPGE